MIKHLLSAAGRPGAASLSRRQFLGSAAGGAALAVAGVGAPSRAAHAATSRAEVTARYGDYPWDDPVANQEMLTRLYATMEPGKLQYLYFFGRGVGTTSPTDFTPLFRLESIAAVKSYPQPDGSIRYESGQIILFLDWHTGEVLETWRNPYTDEICEVFHYRDYPVVFTMDPRKMEERYKDPTRDNASSFILDWQFRKDRGYGDVFVETKIKNRLDPTVWKRESVGEYWQTFEHYQWQALIEELVDRDLPSIPSMYGDVQTFKPFEPWMLMGQRPGKVFQQKSIIKIDGLHQIPRHVADYVEKNMAEFLDLSDLPDKAYKLNDQHFREAREPME